MSYLERLRAVEHEKTGTLGTDKADKRASVSFVSAPSTQFPGEADLSEAHSNQHSSQRQCSVCGQQARFGYGYTCGTARKGAGSARRIARQSWERLNMIAYDKNPVTNRGEALSEIWYDRAIRSHAVSAELERLSR